MPPSINLTFQGSLLFSPPGATFDFSNSRFLEPIFVSLGGSRNPDSTYCTCIFGRTNTCGSVKRKLRSECHSGEYSRIGRDIPAFGEARLAIQNSLSEFCDKEAALQSTAVQNKQLVGLKCIHLYVESVCENIQLLDKLHSFSCGIKADSFLFAQLFF